jgi:chromosomal replication initiator protein
MEHTANDVWSRILEEARTVLPEQAYQTWLAPTEAIAVSQDLLVVSTPNPFAVDWVEDKYGTLLTSLGERLFGRRFTISVQFHSDGTTGPRPPAAAEVATPAAEAGPGPAPASTPAPAVDGPSSSSPLNERYSFDRFVVGNNNQMAAAAAHAVAEAPGPRLQPPVHLRRGRARQDPPHACDRPCHPRAGPGKRVIYISSERFTNELVTAIQEGTMAEFRRQLPADRPAAGRRHPVPGREGAHAGGVLPHLQRAPRRAAADRPHLGPAAQGDRLEDRLISRFEWGLVTDIRRRTSRPASPSCATRSRRRARDPE